MLCFLKDFLPHMLKKLHMLQTRSPYVAHMQPICGPYVSAAVVPAHAPHFDQSAIFTGTSAPYLLANTHFFYPPPPPLSNISLFLAFLTAATFLFSFGSGEDDPIARTTNGIIIQVAPYPPPPPPPSFVGMWPVLCKPCATNTLL